MTHTIIKGVSDFCTLLRKRVIAQSRTSLRSGAVEDTSSRLRLLLARA